MTKATKNGLILAILPTCLGGAVSACKATTGTTSGVRASAAEIVESPCGDKPILIVTSESATLTLKTGEKYPTGVFLRELTDPLIEFVRSGCRLEFATPHGTPPTIDSNSLELLWSYYPYPELQADAARHRDEALRLATVAYGRLRFSDEKPQWPRLTAEVQDLVAAYRAKQSTLAEVPPQDLGQIAARLEALDGAGQASPYAGLFVPGGHVPMEDLVVSPELGRVLNHFHRHSLPTGLICHAPVALLSTKQVGDMTYDGYHVTVAERVGEQMLEEIGPLQGYHVKSYVDDDLEANGVILNQNPWPAYPQVIADRELITGQNPASAPFMAQTFIESITQFRLHDGSAGWWTNRSRYLAAQSLRDTQQSIMNKAKEAADLLVRANVSLEAKRRFFFNLIGVNAAGTGITGNIFLSPTYLRAFDSSMKLAVQGSKRSIYPANATPSSLMYEFQIPVPQFNVTTNLFNILELQHNYFYVFPTPFYQYAIDELEKQMIPLATAVAVSGANTGIGSATATSPDATGTAAPADGTSTDAAQ